MDQTSKLKEQKDHGTSVFPCGLYEIFDDVPWDGVKHHWHDEIEILYFMKGSFKVTINMESFSIDQECFFFVNPGEIHSVDVYTPAIESAVVFHPCILNFEHYDLAQTQLLQPLTKGEILLPRFLDITHPAFSRIKREYLDILNVFHQTGFFLSREYETVTEDVASQLFIRAGLLKILGTLSSFSLLTHPEKADDYRVRIIKSSLEFIRNHYQDKIYIRDLAENANMNEYRIKQAIILLQTTDEAIMDICLDCGFNNLGNFLREFKKHTGFTPLQYRKHFSSKKS